MKIHSLFSIESKKNKWRTIKVGDVLGLRNLWRPRNVVLGLCRLRRPPIARSGGHVWQDWPPDGGDFVLINDHLHDLAPVHHSRGSGREHRMVRWKTWTCIGTNGVYTDNFRWAISKPSQVLPLVQILISFEIDKCLIFTIASFQCVNIVLWAFSKFSKF